MKNHKKLIIILMLMIIIIMIIVGILLAKDSINEDTQISEEEWNDVEEGIKFDNNDNGFQIVKDPNVFYSIINSLSKYLQIVSYNGSSDIQDNPYRIESSEQQKNLIIDLLDKTYVDNNDISQNYDTNIELIDYTYNLIPINMKVRYDENIIVYLVNVYIENNTNQSLEEKYYIVRIDNNNSTFSIEPITKEVSNIDSIMVEESSELIQQNQYNEYAIETISIERLVKIYMDHFISMMIKYPEVVYDNYLDEEYRDKRFPNLEDFVNYVEKNNDEISQLRATKYSIQEGEGETEKTEYVLMDQYENTYEFYENGTMEYKVKMDTYTIPTETFTSTYNGSDEQYKVMMNIDKWIEMLNRRDYQTAYTKLDETFRNNTFNTQENFENYMRELLPLQYNIEYKDFTKEGDTYIQDIELIDITNENNDIIQITVIMKLLDGIDYTMSFNSN